MLLKQIVCLQKPKIHHFRLIHLSQKYGQATNRSAFTLTKRNKKDRIDGGAIFLLVCNFSKFSRFVSVNLDYSN